MIELVDAKKFKELVENKSKEDIILDIRSDIEFRLAHIDGAIQMNMFDSNFQDRLNELDKDKTYFMYCMSGCRSNDALELMRELGFKNVYELRGGLVSWLNSGYETVK